MKKRRKQSFHFWSNFDHPFPREDDWTEKYKQWWKNLQPLGNSNVSKPKLYLLSHFQEKHDYFLQYLGYFCQETEQGHKSNG